MSRSRTARAPEPAPRLLGAVLAGGRSLRMGRTKALLPWSGSEPLVRWIARRIEPLCARVEVASGGRSDVEDAVRGHFATFPDAGEPRPEERTVGPLGALAAALERAVQLGLDGVLVVSCDMPLVEPDDLRPLVAALGAGADAALFCVEGRDQPLCAVYGARCVHGARAALARGDRRVVSLLASASGNLPTPRVERRVPDEKTASRLMNVNTPTDYDRARTFPT